MGSYRYSKPPPEHTAVEMELIMDRMGAGGLILVAVAMIVLGAVMRWDLVDWLIDAVGFLFIAGGFVTGIVGLIRLFAGGSKHEATSF